jgi:hypothetical protein
VDVRLTEWVNGELDGEGMEGPVEVVQVRFSSREIVRREKA